MKKALLYPAMAFYHKDGFVSAWKQATRYAGEDGKIATLPDIIHARLNTKPGSVPWETYFTTMSAEYVGRTRKGNRILIVAHGIGPMATLDGILKAYSFEFKDKTRQHDGGRITYEEFYALESGKYGDVSIIDLDDYFERYEYPFLQTLSGFMAKKDPLVHARLGKRAAEYIDLHYSFAREWHKEQAGIDEENRYNLSNWEEYLDRRRAAHFKYAKWMFMGAPIITMGDADNCTYGMSRHSMKHLAHPEEIIFPLDRDGLPLAHLLSISGLSNLFTQGEDCGNLVTDISCHEWWNGVRLVAVCGQDEVADIHRGVSNVHNLIYRNWQKLMQPLSKPGRFGFRMLMKIGNHWFTEYLKRGAGMDNGEPEYLVTSIEPIGKPVEFITTIGGYHGFVKYDIKEVCAIAPQKANAYTTVGDWEIVNRKGNLGYHRVRVQFYRIEADTTQRLIREDELFNDYDKLIELILNNEIKA